MAYRKKRNVITPEEIDTGVIYGLNYPRGLMRMADYVGLEVVVNKLRRAL